MLILIFSFIYTSVEVWDDIERYNASIGKREDVELSEILEEIVNEEFSMEVDTIPDLQDPSISANAIPKSMFHYTDSKNKEYCPLCLKEAYLFTENLSKSSTHCPLLESVQFSETSAFSHIDTLEKATFEMVYKQLSEEAHSISLERVLEYLKHSGDINLNYITWITNKLSKVFIIPEFEYTQNLTESQRLQIIIKYFMKNECKFKFREEWKRDFKRGSYWNQLEKVYRNNRIWDNDKYKITEITSRKIAEITLYFRRKNYVYFPADLLTITNFAYERIQSLPKDKNSFLISNLFFLILSSEKTVKVKILSFSRLLAILRIYFYNPTNLTEDQTYFFIMQANRILRRDNFNTNFFYIEMKNFLEFKDTRYEINYQICNLKIESDIAYDFALSTLLPTILILSGIW